MEYLKGIDSFSGLVSIYSFDIMPDGSFGEIRIMQVNNANHNVLVSNPDAPEFYPGIPWRAYYSEVNHEQFCYRCGSENIPLYSYVNAHGYWLKCFYLPISPPEGIDAGPDKDGKRTAYVLFIMNRSKEIDSTAMSMRSSDVSEAVINISIKLHETQDFIKSLADTMGELRKLCGSRLCSLYMVDEKTQECAFINESGINENYLMGIAKSMNCSTPFEVANAWKKDLDGSDCLLLEDLSIVKERDPVWYESLTMHGITSIILYEIRFNRKLVGFIWAADFDISRMFEIKEILGLTSFMLAAVIANYQLISKLEEKSSIDGLTKVYNRNTMNNRVDKYVSGAVKLPETMGVVFADLNGLKIINDTEGHIAGDKVLSRAAALLKIAYSDYDVYRAGGDEFIVLCSDITQEKLDQCTAQLRAFANSTSDVSFAVGTVFCTGKYDIRKAMHEADEIMYVDKKEYYRKHPDKDRRRHYQ
ncbi:diguanylate cyclase (GGDEF) domain-containing protein [Ruminococcus flavefaciens]|uniref:Diguanylate cyclase (GGDEF) domain-containing protein n=1 Tax=Ruminococcus flavefaciens TaxID=1265 RepID=A0A1H6I1B6_RUMFL|nr:sensor domain-containing diguanylate cyclase [Ruminococcus flavefaciens]SEH40304.1 diguanylate cyclase (GGDEF) domain-containing protein [Ruminococcus flavefaciens]